MKVVVLGATGMLGNAVTSHFLGIDDIEVQFSYRNPHVVFEKNTAVSYMSGAFPFVVGQDSLSSIPNADFIINCIGTIKPFMAENPIKSIEINSIFPRELANHCKRRDVGLIHVTSDCVFSGKGGKYTEEDPHDALDDYGKSKSLGEPDNCMVLRTSIIGSEIHKDASLVAWARSMDGQKVRGFTNHFWNGVTTDHYGSVTEQIIRGGLYEEGTFHVHSNTVDKHELLTMISKRFDLNLNIEPWETEQTVDRSLSTVKDLNGKLLIPSLEEQIANMRDPEV